MGNQSRKIKKRMSSRGQTTEAFDGMTDEIAHALRERVVEGDPEVFVEWARRVMADYVAIRLLMGGSLRAKVEGRQIVFMGEEGTAE